MILDERKFDIDDLVKDGQAAGEFQDYYLQSKVRFLAILLYLVMENCVGFFWGKSTKNYSI